MKLSCFIKTHLVERVEKQFCEPSAETVPNTSLLGLILLFHIENMHVSLPRLDRVDPGGSLQPGHQRIIRLTQARGSD